MAEYLHIDLCCGLGGWQAPFEESDRWRSVGIDIQADLEADVRGDVRTLPVDCRPDLLTASPPCRWFTRSRLPWYDDPDPPMGLVWAVLEAVEDLQPKWWVLENVGGLTDRWRPADHVAWPWYFWGDFPLVDVPPIPKHRNQLSKDNRSEVAAEVPYPIARSFKVAVETWG